tara:strand:+ start:3459 stop:4682 length:1224 start_codon:yes stop_codon:yes gene_type:complete
MSNIVSGTQGFVALDADLVGESPDGASAALMQIAKAGTVEMVEARTVTEMAPVGLNQDHDEATMLIAAAEAGVAEMTRPQLTRLIRNLRKDGCPIMPTQRGEKKSDLQARILHWTSMPRQVPVINNADDGLVGVDPLSLKQVIDFGLMGVLGSRPGVRLDIDCSSGSAVITEAIRTGVSQREWIQTVNDNGKTGARRKARTVVEMSSRKARGIVKTARRFGCDDNEGFLLRGNKKPVCTSANGVVGYAAEGRNTCQVCGGPAYVEIYRAGASRVNATFVPMLCLKPDGRWVREANGTGNLKVVYTNQQKKSRRHQFKIDGRPVWLHGTAVRVEVPLALDASRVLGGETIPVWAFVATGEKSGDYSPMTLNNWESRMLRTLLNVCKKAGVEYHIGETKIRRNLNTGAV